MNWSQGVAVLVMTAWVGGCAGRQSTPDAEGPHGVFHNAGLHEVSQREYRIDPPDEITVKAPDIKELDGQHQVVRPDGKISLELVGEVLIAGKTPMEIADELNRLASRVYVKPEIRVDVTPNSKFYYVFGFGSGTQGKYPYTGRITVLSAVAQAGYSYEAWPTQIRISRPNRNGEPNSTAVVDFTKMVSYGDLSQNYLVEEGDIIEIPYSPLAKFSKDLNLLIGPFAAAASGISTPVSVVGSAQSIQNNRR